MKRGLEIALVVIVICALAAAVTANLGSGTADTVYGQGSFTAAFTGSDTGPGTMGAPYAVDIDDTGNLYIAEEGGRRVTVCTGTSGAPSDTNADIFFGADSAAATQVGTSAIRMQVPTAVKADSWGNLWVVDVFAHRILRFNAVASAINAANTVDTQADLVIGQASFTTAYSGTSDTMLQNPFDIDFDTAGNLYVSDRGNNRVLRYNATAGQITDTTADVVWGQPTMRANTANNDAAGGAAVSTIGLDDPRGICLLENGCELVVADGGNNRVLIYDAASVASPDTTAQSVFGQSSFTTAYSGVSDTMLSTNIQDVEAYKRGRLFVVDDGNNRIVYIHEGDTKFAGVIGQRSFDTNVANNNGHGGTSRSAHTLSGPTGIAVDQWGNIYMADNANNRVLYMVFGTSLYGDDDDDCFVATAAYGGEARELDILHQFRDETLLSSRAGRGLVSFYYAYGPSAASMIEGSSTARLLTRAALVPAVGFASLVNLLGLFGAFAFLLAGAFAVASFRRN